MPWRYFSKAQADSSRPQGAGICDRCGDTYNLARLHWQYQWRGVSLQNVRFRVCHRCMDVPSAFLKAILLPEDPVPLMNPRPNNFATQMSNFSPATHWDQPFGRWDASEGSGTPTYWDPS